METMLTNQYNLLKDARSVLLHYCQTIPAADFVQELKDFGRGSIRNLLVHTINAYEAWLGNFALAKNVSFTQMESVRETADILPVFDKTNDLVQDFIQVFAGNYEKEIKGEIIRGKAVSTTPFTLFTHVLTHEFHHKGQILSMGRHLGYLPPDTDVLR
jgi:uncharacterized damage-inducible protein DinB